MSSDALVRRVCATYRTQRAALGERVAHPLATIVRDRARPDVWDANHASDVRAESPAEIEEVLGALDAAMADHAKVRKVFCDPQTPASFVARLHVEGFRREGTVQLVLEGDLEAAPSSPAVRRAEREDDWASVAALTAAWFREEAEKAGRAAPSASFLAQMIDFRREMAGLFHAWIAHDEGDVGMLSSWEGVDGLGMVEWLYVRRDRRRRGLASVLVHHAVADARARGAREVLIGASDAEDDPVPRRLYHALGFRPVCVTEEYTRFR